MDIPHGSPGGGPRIRPGTSPSRHHGLNALSPLQGLSPMQSTRNIDRSGSYSERTFHGDRPELLGRSQSQRLHRRTPSAGTGSAQGDDSASLGGHSRSGSITRSLSRRQSVYRSAEEWGQGKEYADENLTNPQSLFSRLTIVRAPGGEKKEEGLRRRSKSTTALAPAFNSGIIAPQDIPATSGRAPRRSFASSFNTLTPLSSHTNTGSNTPTAVRASPSGHIPGLSDAVHRISNIYSADSDARTKSYTPAEVVEIARGLASPVLMPEGGFKGAELKRRKSSGASYKRSPIGVGLGMTDISPEKPAMALEPVEYVQLDDDMLLPFVNRMEEVADLLKHPSNAGLFTLLKSAFPKEPARKNWQELSPEQWNWDEFVQHLTATDRLECPDYAWIFRARQAVRKRSVALWEKVGVCLGCDDMLLNAGEEGVRATWKGLGAPDDDDEEETGFMSHVWIEGLQPVDPDELARQEQAERDFVKEFGDIVDDDPEATAGMTALLGPIGEGEEEDSNTAGSRGSGQTTAQKAGSRDKRDPLMISPMSPISALPASPSSPMSRRQNSSHSPTKLTGTMPPPERRASRSKSFVGLTIISSPATSGPSQFPRSPVHTPGAFGTSLPGQNQSGFGQSSFGGSPVITMDRGPGEALFPSSFSSLSVEPNLGRAASGTLGTTKPPGVESMFGAGRGSRGMMVGGDDHGSGLGMTLGGAHGGGNAGQGGGGGWRGMRRKHSGTGLSESAITFASESDYAHSGDHHE